MKNPMTRYSDEECEHLIEQVLQSVDSPFASIPGEIWSSVGEELNRSPNSVMNKYYSLRKQRKWKNYISSFLTNPTTQENPTTNPGPDPEIPPAPEEASPEAGIRIFQVKVRFGKHLELSIPTVAEDMYEASCIAQRIADDYNGEPLSVSLIDEICTSKDKVVTYSIKIDPK